MEKQDWLLMRGGAIPIEVIHLCYKEKNGYEDDINKFIMMFHTFTDDPLPFIVDKKVHQPIPIEQILKVVTKHFNTKFNL